MCFLNRKRYLKRENAIHTPHTHYYKTVVNPSGSRKSFVIKSVRKSIIKLEAIETDVYSQGQHNL